MDKGIEELFIKGEGLIRTGDWELATSLFDLILKRCKDGKDPIAMARALRKLGYVESMRGLFDQAVGRYIKALDMFMGQKEVLETAETLRGLGFVHWRKGDFNMASEYFNQALERAAQAGSKQVQGSILIDIGNVMNSEGRLEEGKRLYGNAISILEGTADPFDLHRAMINLGDIHLEKGELDIAREVFQRCTDHCRSKRDMANLPWALLNLSETLVRLKDLKPVQGLLSEAWDILEECDDRIGMTAVKRVRGQAATAIGNWSGAVEEYERALKDCKAMGMPEREGRVLMLYGTMLLEKGDRKKGRNMLAKALEIFEDLGSKKEAEKVRTVLGPD